MKICFVAPANNYHIKKWSSWFASQQHEVHIISFTQETIQNVTIHYINSGVVSISDSYTKKLKYLLYAKEIRKIINEIKPDIINAHYATSYGAVMALTGIDNYILSVWGYDIYNFPKKSIFHRLLLQYALKKATHIFSTSKAMAVETQKYTNKTIDITPFGVDVELFNPNKRNRNTRYNYSKDRFVVGTIKALSPKYGIDYLIKAVAIVQKSHSEIPIQLRIAGKGDYEKEYRELAIKCGVKVDWLGFISQEEVAKEWANFDLGVVFSTLDSESFGVSAVEAQACEIPIIISDIPGLMEATVPGETSEVVERMNEYALAEKIVDLYNKPEKRKEMGRSGRQFVIDNYEIDNCFRKIYSYMVKYQRK